MTSHYATVDGKYPLAVSPFAFGLETGIWKLMVFSFWMFSNIMGQGTTFGGSLLVALLPEAGLAVYEMVRIKRIGWIQQALLDAINSARMVEETGYTTILGYNKVRRAPLFYLDKKAEGYLLTFVPRGCPNANRDLLPFLQRELMKYDVIPTGRLGHQYLVRKRRKKGSLIDESLFY